MNEQSSITHVCLSAGPQRARRLGAVSPGSAAVLDAVQRPLRFALLRCVPRAVRERSIKPVRLGARVLHRAAVCRARRAFQRIMDIAVALHQVADRLLLDEEYREEDAQYRRDLQGLNALRSAQLDRAMHQGHDVRATQSN